MQTQGWPSESLAVSFILPFLHPKQYLVDDSPWDVAVKSMAKLNAEGE